MTPSKVLLPVANMDKCKINYPVKKSAEAGSSTFQNSLAQTPGPDLAWQDAVMESEAFIISENSYISTSRRARAGQHSPRASTGMSEAN